MLLKSKRFMGEGVAKCMEFSITLFTAIPHACFL